MKKIIKESLIIMLVAILFNVNIVLAETSETTVNLGEKEEVIFDSDGQTGHNTQNAGGDYTNNTNSETTYNYSQNESNALTYRSNIYNTVSGWYSQLQSNTADFYTSGIGENISTITFGTVPKSEVAGLINNVTTWENIEGADWVKQNSLPTLKLTEDENSVYNTLTDDEKQDIRKQVVLNENPEGSIGIDVQTGSSLGGRFANLIIKVRETSNGKIIIEKEDPFTGTITYTNPFSIPGKPIRPDAFAGFPPLRDSTDYTDRFDGFFGIANNEKWPTSIDKDGNIFYNYDPTVLGGGSTASLCDEISIALLTNYHIYSVQKDYVQDINYTSDERRWTVYKDGVQVGDPIITDNPEHELNFTEIYNIHGAGLYVVEAEQLAYVTTGTYVKYDICEYLFETDTGNILYFSESLVTNRGGGSLLLNQTTNTQPEWHKTGDTFNVTVNDLGQYEVDGYSTEREE